MSFFKTIDWLFFLLIALIITFGTVILISLGVFNFPQHPAYLFLALFLFFVFANIDYRLYKNFDFIFYGLALFLLIITPIFGESIRGAVRWLNFGPISLQTSELIKPLLILALVNFGLKLDLKKLKDSLFLFALFLPILFLIFKQPDLGSAIIYFVIFLAIFYNSRGRLLYLILGFLLAGLASPIIWRFLKEYQKQRIMSFLNPAVDPLGTGYNLIQAVVTAGSGRLFGKGLGAGTQSTLRFLPERSTDFIFASLAEELGFIGSLILLSLFFLLFLKFLVIAGQVKDQYGRNIVLVIFLMLLLQVVINVGMNLGIMPITGITLPLISQGGSSLLAIMICLGIINNISFIGRKRF